MATESFIDLERLLQPISEDNPCGSDIRDDPSPSSPYQTIKAERNQARAAERKSIHDGDSLEAADHWRQISELAPTIIRDHGKDLEVASWYAEAMIRRHGFAGLKDAFMLIEGLIDNFWENLHPMPDEYGIETRVSCLSGLNGEGAEGVLIAPLRKVAITEGCSPGPYSLWQYRQALDIQKAPNEKLRQEKIQKVGFSIDDVDKSVTESSEIFYGNIRDDLQLSIEAFKRVGTKLDEHCGIHEAPPTRTIVEMLEECLGVINHIASSKMPADISDEEAEVVEQTTDDDGVVTQKVVVAKGPIASREDAFKQLLEISEYFRKTEPHSPVSYILQKAVKWGNMSLAELMGELITDETTRERYSELTGVQCDAEEE